MNPGHRRRERLGRALCALSAVVSLASSSGAQSTAGFPMPGGAPSASARPTPPPPSAPTYPPPGYAPPGYAPPRPAPTYPPTGYPPPGYAPPGYAPPAYAPRPQPPQGYAPPAYPPRPQAPPTGYPPPAQGYAPSQYPGVAPFPTAPPAPPPPPNPLVDEQMRYRQVLGAYQRPGQQAPAQQTPTGNRGTYVRVVDQSRRRHDGLYFRFALGIGIGHDSVTTDTPLSTDNVFTFTPGNLDASGTGFAWMTELAVGFTPAPGLVLGVGSYTATIPKIKAASKDTHTGKYDERISQLAILGPVVDWYFFPKLGFHAQASPGLATYVAGASVPEVEGPFAQAHTAVGFGFMLGTGYDWWIGDQWSLGVLARITYGATSGAANANFTHDSYSPAFLVTATYH